MGAGAACSRRRPHPRHARVAPPPPRGDPGGAPPGSGGDGGCDLPRQDPESGGDVPPSRYQGSRGGAHGELPLGGLFFFAIFSSKAFYKTFSQSFSSVLKTFFAPFLELFQTFSPKICVRLWFQILMIFFPLFFDKIFKVFFQTFSLKVFFQTFFKIF
jgi:hypothetical protein